MIRIMIIEDEPPILRDTKHLIQTYHKDFIVVAEAFDGEEALSMIAAAKPDVIITDISMMAMDGLELLTVVHKLYPNIITIILSGYQEFEFARKAMKLGVEDYLLKPLSVEALAELLERVSFKFYETVQASWQAYWESLVQAKSNREMPVASIFTVFSSYVLSIGPYVTFSIGKYYYNRFVWDRLVITKKLDEAFAFLGNVWVVDGSTGNEKVIIIGFRDITDSLADVSDQVYNLISEAIPLPITLVKGNEFIKPEDLSYDIPKSILKLSKSVTPGRSQYLFDNVWNHASDPQSLQIDANMVNRLSLYIQKKQKEPFNQELDHILDSLEEAEAPQIFIEMHFRYLLSVCYQNHSISQAHDRVHLELELDELLSNAFSFKEIKEGLKYIFDGFFPSALSKQNDSNLLVNQIEEYLQKHYTESINHQVLSERFGLVPYYISKIFKNKMGVSPVEYLTKLRIQKSKELLIERPDLLSKEISLLTGFQEQYYFSKVFKALTGLTPIEYREKNLEKD
ncbi:response regulator [Paenibacillus psychroresistens]|uniref:Response regulator n=1 Tax=Paenibacillus psychroresistens TaxID=1778678 RepID=A0A6B8RHN1_9BACL|nr:response regulator [Paenibacillus psychroresistens]QGQ95105.1 response regulator [Paenibacillus psychroresistens]